MPDPHPCLYCGGTDFTVLHAGIEDRLRFAPGKRDWLRCRDCGSAILSPFPAVSEIPAGKILGSVLVISGLVQIMQSAKMLNRIGFLWHMLLGVLATVGGALIYMDPFAGVVALTLLIAIIFALHGVTQIAFAIRLRGQSGWHWFLVSGCIALIAGGLLLAKLPYSHSFTPATVAGVSLLFAGCAYVAIALAARMAAAS